MRSKRLMGFSLLEVLTVVLIIGIVAAIGIPIIATSLRSYHLKIAATALDQQFSLCRQRALAANTSRRIRITVNGALTRAEIDTNGDGNYDGNDDPPTVIDMSGMTVLSQDSPIVRTFSSRGEALVPPNPNPQSIKLRYRGKQRLITIEQRGAVIVGPETAES